jgi:hypothetical protein
MGLLALAGSGGGGGWLGSSMRWGGGQPTVGVAGQSPAALMDRPMVSPAHQGQVLKVGRATMQPVAQMMGLTPGRGSVAAGHRAATVADHQGGPLGGRDDPAGPADLQRLGRATPEGRGKPGRCRLEPGRQAAIAAGFVAGVVLAGGDGAVVVVGGVAADQDPGDRAVTGQPAARLRVQRPHPTGLPA